MYDPSIMSFVLISDEKEINSVVSAAAELVKGG